MRGLLDPKMDFVFKNIFGSEKHPNILISFLNATLKPKDLITAVEIKNTDLNKEYIEELMSLPVTIQINAESLSDWKQSHTLIKMFKRGQAHILGSDCHGIHHRPPNLMEGRQILGKKAGEACIRRLDEYGMDLLQQITKDKISGDRVIRRISIMSKKVAIIISVVLFMILIALIICEKAFPTGGSDLISSLF